MSFRPSFDSFRRFAGTFTFHGGSTFSGIAFSLLLATSVASAQDQAAQPPKPVAHLDLSSLGYSEPSRAERLTDEADLSLDYVDAQHVLLTFNPKKLLRRDPNCPPGHDDRMIHAAILEVPSGKRVKEADWYLHDQRRYLWPLGSGHFLLRKLNSLYLVDSDLNEKLLLQSPKDIVWLTVSANGKQIILETREEPNSDKAGADSAQKSKSKFVVQFLDVNSLKAEQTIESGGLVHLNGNGTGYADALRKGDVWLVRFGPTPTQRKNIARVKSTCSPEVIYSTNNSLLIGRCPPGRSDYGVSAFTISGRRLWAQHWDHKRFSPAIVRSDDNRRFAVSSLSVAEWKGKAPYSAEDETDANHQLEQNIQIFETASGNPVRILQASPVVVSAQNFSLSPDAMQLAIIRDSQLELYDLPKISDEEQSNLSALKADAPGLVLATKPGDTADNPSDDDSDVAADLPPVPTPGRDAPASSEGATVAPEPAATPVATSSESSAEPLATFRASTQVVAVDVVVTDSKDHPVKGLRQEDFTISEDGKPQNLRSYREASAESPAAATPEPEIKVIPNVFSNDRQEAPSGSVTIILLDLLNTQAPDQQWARKSLMKFLASKAKPPNSQFALCTLSAGNHLRLIQGFTSNENRLIAAASAKRAQPQSARWQSASTGTERAVENLRDLTQSDPMNGFTSLLHAMDQVQAEEHVEDTDSRVSVTLDALVQLARYLSGIPGRKNLVWLSGSFPISIFAQQANGDIPSDSRNYSDKVRMATALLGQGHVAVYPVDVRGLDADFTASDNGGMARLGPGSPLAAGQLETTGNLDPTQQRSLKQMSDLSAEWTTMNQVAADTGGKAFTGTNGIADAIGIASEQGSNYYSISYSPTNRDYNGKFRKIKVTLAAKGYRLHYRPGYFASDPHAPLKDTSHSARSAAMQHGSPESHEVRFVARVAPFGPKTKLDTAEKGKGLILLAKKDGKIPATVQVQHHGLDFAIDSGDLRFLPMPKDVRRCVLNFMIASYDDDGRQVSGVVIVWTSDLTPAEYKEVLTGGVRIHQEVDIPVAATSLRLGIEDQNSSRLGTLEVPLPLPVPADLPRIAKHSLPEIEPD
jgi:VWFA-related protein